MSGQESVKSWIDMVNSSSLTPGQKSDAITYLKAKYTLIDAVVMATRTKRRITCIPPEMRE